MKDFITENYKQFTLLFILVAITFYGMYTGSIEMIDKILLATLTALDVKSIFNKKE